MSAVAQDTGSRQPDERKWCIGCSKDDKTTPRTADGHPDLSGFWNNPDAWRYYGDDELNWNRTGNQQARADFAVNEKLVNTIDSRYLSVQGSTSEQVFQALEARTEKIAMTLRMTAAEERRKADSDRCGEELSPAPRGRADDQKYHRRADRVVLHPPSAFAPPPRS